MILSAVFVWEIYIGKSLMTFVTISLLTGNANVFASFVIKYESRTRNKIKEETIKAGFIVAAVSMIFKKKISFSFLNEVLSAIVINFYILHQLHFY